MRIILCDMYCAKIIISYPIYCSSQLHNTGIMAAHMAWLLNVSHMFMHLNIWSQSGNSV